MHHVSPIDVKVPRHAANALGGPTVAAEVIRATYSFHPAEKDSLNPQPELSSFHSPARIHARWWRCRWRAASTLHKRVLAPAQREEKKMKKNACNWVLLNIKVKFFLMLRREIRFFERLNKSSQRCQKHVFLLNFAVWITHFYLSPQRLWNVTAEACADMWRGAGWGWHTQR